MSVASAGEAVVSRLETLFRRETDVLWLGFGLAAGVLVYLTYVRTHAYPAYGGGLFLEIAQQIRLHGYGLPKTIPHYTEGGVPAAYPPLMFYVAAVIRELTAVPRITYSLYVPGLLVLAYLVPYYFLAKDLLGTPRRAGFATALFAVTPAALQWHISAGGIARAAALLFAITGAYTGLRLFRSGDRKWLVPSTILFGLVVLTHPVYTLFFGLTYLLLFARYSRTPHGLLHGAVVAGGGIVLAAPWWLQVVSLHGLDVFTAAAGTHSGVGGHASPGAAGFIASLDPNLEWGFYGLAYLGGGYALLRRRWFLPAWLAASAYVIGKPRFQFVAGSMLSAMFIAEAVLPAVRRRFTESPSLGRSWTARLAPVAVAALVVVSAAGIGVAYAAGELNTHSGSRTQPAFLDDADREAMAWTQANTDPDATFVVLGDAAEWFPLFADRTMLVGPWGVEWTTPKAYRSQLQLFKSISDCDTASCLTWELAVSGKDPDYVVVPKGEYTVRGIEYHQSDRMRSSLLQSNRYEIVHENEGVIVVAVDQSAGGAAVTRLDPGPPRPGG